MQRRKILRLNYKNELIFYNTCGDPSIPFLKPIV